jgi:hypothetical protein
MEALTKISADQIEIENSIIVIQEEIKNDISGIQGNTSSDQEELRKEISAIRCS